MWDYRARLVSVHDADTCRLELDLGFSVRVEHAVRLAGVHAPELSQPGGPQARDCALLWFSTLDLARRWPLLVTTEQTVTFEPSQRQSFVRYVATVFRLGHPGRPSLNDYLSAYLAAHPEWPPGA